MVTFVPVMLLIIWSGNKKNIDVRLNDQTLCPTDKRYIKGTTYILMDFSEPLSKRQRNELQKLIEVASKNLKKYERLSISRMEPDLKNPRISLFDLCNPTELTGIKDAVGRSVDPKKDCPAIVRGEFKFHQRVGEATQKRIKNICKNKDDLDKKSGMSLIPLPQKIMSKCALILSAA